MNTKRICGIAALVAGMPLAIGGLAGMSHYNTELDKMDKEGYGREEKADSREYQDAKTAHGCSTAAFLAGFALTGAGVPLTLSRKRKCFYEVDFNQTRGAA